jgi:hypothetical protein
MAFMKYNRLKAIIAEAQSIVDEFDVNRAAELANRGDDAPAGPMGGARKPADDEDAPAPVMDSAIRTRGETELEYAKRMQAHYAAMAAIAPENYKRLWRR